MPYLVDLRNDGNGNAAGSPHGPVRRGELPDCELVFVTTMPVPAKQHLPGPMHALIDEARAVGGAIAMDPFPIAGQAVGRLVVLPYGGSEIAEHRGEVFAATLAMAGYAEHVLGAKILGLGSLTVPLTRGGRTVAEHIRKQGLSIVADHGDDATAAALYDGAVDVAGITDTDRIIVLGPGIVGKGLVTLFASHGYPVTLWGLPRHSATMSSFVAMLDPGNLVTVSIDPADIASHDVAFVLTSGGTFPASMFGDGTLVFDGAIPRGTSDNPDWVARGITRISTAGQVTVPNIGHTSAEWGTRPGQLYSCAAGCCWHALRVARGEPPQHHVGPATLGYMEEARLGFQSMGWSHVDIRSGLNASTRADDRATSVAPSLTLGAPRGRPRPCHAVAHLTRGRGDIRNRPICRANPPAPAT